MHDPRLECQECSWHSCKWPLSSPLFLFACRESSRSPGPLPATAAQPVFMPVAAGPSGPQPAFLSVASASADPQRPYVPATRENSVPQPAYVPVTLAATVPPAFIPVTRHSSDYPKAPAPSSGFKPLSVPPSGAYAPQNTAAARQHAAELDRQGTPPAREASRRFGGKRSLEADRRDRSQRQACILNLKICRRWLGEHIQPRVVEISPLLFGLSLFQACDFAAADAQPVQDVCHVPPGVAQCTDPAARRQQMALH